MFVFRIRCASMTEKLMLQNTSNTCGLSAVVLLAHPRSQMLICKIVEESLQPAAAKSWFCYIHDSRDNFKHFKLINFITLNQCCPIRSPPTHFQLLARVTHQFSD